MSLKTENMFCKNGGCAGMTISQLLKAPLINIFGATMLKYFNHLQKILLYLPRLSLFYHRD
jgi:hypothetical protein